MSAAASRQAAASSVVTPSSRASSLSFAARSAARGEVGLRHQVGVDVVVLDRAVLVRPGHALDAELAVGVVLAERAPQPGGLDQQRQADLALELLVVGGVEVPDDGVGDVGVDVEGGGAGRPVPGALLAVDRPPRERGALPGRAPWRAPWPSAAWCAASAARRPPRRAGCRSAPAARTSRCPRTCARRSPVPVRPLAGIGRCSARAPACRMWNRPNRTACWISTSPSTSTSAPSQKSSRYARCSSSSPSQPVSSAAASAPLTWSTSAGRDRWRDQP